jgi:putative ABC transport system permease protein
MQLAPESLPRRAEVGLNWTVALFALASALVTGLVFGVAPALQAARASIQGVLKDSSRSATPESARMRRVLIVAESRSPRAAGRRHARAQLLAAQHVDPGFDSDRVTMARLWLPQPNTRHGTVFHAGRAGPFLHDYLAELGPLSEHVEYTGLPLTNANRFLASRSRHGNRPKSHCARVVRRQNTSPPGHSARSRTAALEQDDEQHPQAVVINETMARTSAQPGRHRQAVPALVRPGSQPPAPPIAWITVVGIVGDVHSDGSTAGAAGDVDRSGGSRSPCRCRRPRPGQNAADLLTSDGCAWIPIAVADTQMVEAYLGRQIEAPRSYMLFLGTFGAVATLLAALGIYGVVAHAVSQQRREIGIRLALGAARATVVRMVLLDGLRLTLAGVAIGIAGALALTRLLSGLLFGVSAFDPATFAAIAILLSAVALAACWVPARRAASVDPLVALRAD